MFDNFRFNMLNRRAASAESKPAEIIKSLNIKKGDIVADIGSGGGYFTFEFSSEVGSKVKFTLLIQIRILWITYTVNQEKEAVII